jgi:UDP-N-acetylmuramate dehydrogenase
VSAADASERARSIAATLDTLTRALTDVLPAGAVARAAPSAELTTYRTGGPLGVLARVGSEADLLAVRRVVQAHEPRVLVIGRGSNLLVADAGFAGLALLLEGEFERLEIAEHRVTAGSAVPLPVLARRTAAAGETGLEFYVGIPGSVGGAVRMNAGGHGRETVDVVRHIGVLELQSQDGVVIRTPGEMNFGFRQSGLRRSEIVVWVSFGTMPDDAERCMARVAEVVAWRHEHQPGGQNAGSVFVNPTGDSAGRLVDEAGLKGRRVGGAVVSTKHANFIQAEAGATAADVYDLVRLVQAEVNRQFGVQLRPELQLVGFDAGGNA